METNFPASKNTLVRLLLFNILNLCLIKTSMLKIYHNPRCSKSRETLQIIKDEGKEVEIVEYLNQIPTASELKGILTKLGLAPQQILRKGEPVFKEKFKGKTLTNDEWIEAMVTYPKLIERPIVIKGDQAVLGRPPQNVVDLF